jgi:hypothetical protein
LDLIRSEIAGSHQHEDTRFPAAEDTEPASADTIWEMLRSLPKESRTGTSGFTRPFSLDKLKQVMSRVL